MHPRRTARAGTNHPHVGQGTACVPRARPSHGPHGRAARMIPKGRFAGLPVCHPPRGAGFVIRAADGGGGSAAYNETVRALRMSLGRVAPDGMDPLATAALLAGPLLCGVTS